MKDNNYDDGDNSNKKYTLAKVLWFHPVVPRFKRVFANVNDTKNIRWHANERKYDGKINHVADYLQCKKINLLFLNFGHEPKNLRLGLGNDGMNSFGNLSIDHTLWLVLLMIYILYL